MPGSGVSCSGSVGIVSTGSSTIKAVNYIPQGKTTLDLTLDRLDLEPTFYGLTGFRRPQPPHCGSDRQLLDRLIAVAGPWHPLNSGQDRRWPSERSCAPLRGHAGGASRSLHW